MGVRIVFFDCDGTLTDVRSSWQYLHERLGLWDENADEYQRMFRAGRIDYHEFCKRDAALWKGLSEKRIIEITDEIGYRKGVRETIAALTARGVITVILSTGLASLVDRAKRDLGITHAVANELIIEKGVATGGIRINVEHDGREGLHPTTRSRYLSPRGAVRGGPFPSLKRKGSLAARGLDKGSWVRQILGHMTLKREEAAAVGDGEGDLGMFQEVGLAIGYRPNELVASVVDHAFHNGSFIDILEVL